jgi:thioredoxin-related protein
MKKSPLFASLMVFGLLAVGGIGFSILPEKIGMEEVGEATAKTVAGPVKWRAYNKGLEEAQKKNKPVFVQFYATWCGYCRKMDQETFTDSKVQAQLKKFVAVRVTESSEDKVTHQGKVMTERELTAAHGVQGFPTLVFMEPDGKVIGKIPGYLGPKEFRGMLKFIETGSYRTMDYEAFSKKHLKS